MPIPRSFFFNSPFVGLLGNLFKSFFSTRITYNKSFILPHSDIDYLINLFVFRFRHQKSFSNTLDLLQSGSSLFRIPKGRSRPLGFTVINGFKIVFNGRLNLRSLFNSPGMRVLVGSSSRSKSFEWKWGHIPNNSSTSLDIPFNFRYKPFFTQKGSNSLKLLISYKRGDMHGLRS